MNSKRAALAVIWTVLLLLGSASRAEAQARNGFTDATLNDRYGFHVLALSLGLPDVTTGASIPFAVSGYYSSAETELFRERIRSADRAASSKDHTQAPTM